jgi:trimethylguanosine synthase
MRAQYEDYRQRFRRETRRLRGECAHLFAKSAAAEAATRAAERALARSGLVARSVSARGRPNRHVVFEDVADKGGEGGEEAEEGGEEGSAAQDAKEEEDEEDEEMAWAEARSFWRRRLELFSRFGEGVLLDRVGWYSVTPELIARRMAQLCRCDLVVDAMCGVGGNAIQLADTCAHVLAIELDATRLCLARHNAAVYGVAARIDFVCGDAFRLLPSLRGRVDCVLLSPPWGGVGYRLADRLALRELGVDCRELLARAFAATHNVAIVLPFNIDRAEVSERGTEGEAGCSLARAR